MNPPRFPGLFTTVSRLPFFAPNEGEGGGEGGDDPFVERPEDREPDPEGEGGGEPPAGEGEGGEEEPPAGEEGAEGEEGAAPEGEGGEGEGEEPPAGEGGEEEPPKPKTNWKDRQIIKLRQQLKQKDEALAKVAGGNTETASAPASTVTGGQGTDDLVPRAQAVEEAKRALAQEQRVQNINQRSDAMYDAGAKAFPKTWKTRVDEAAQALGDEIIARPEFLETLTELDNSAAVYYELTGDLDNLERVLGLPPAKMGLELAKISGEIAAKKAPRQQSRAPAPIKPIARTSESELSLDDPNLSMEEFNRRMDKLEEQKYAQRRR